MSQYRRHMFEVIPNACQTTVTCKGTLLRRAVNECALLHSDFDIRTKITLLPYPLHPSRLPTVSYVRARYCLSFGLFGFSLSFSFQFHPPPLRSVPCSPPCPVLVALTFIHQFPLATSTIAASLALASTCFFYSHSLLSSSSLFPSFSLPPNVPFRSMRSASLRRFRTRFHRQSSSTTYLLSLVQTTVLFSVRHCFATW